MPYLPALFLSIVLAAYWGRVLRLVWKVRKSTGRSANYVPPERLGLLLRFVWNPVVAAWIIQPVLVAAHTRLPALLRPLPALFRPAAGWAALPVAVGALLATWVCWKKMGKSWRMGINPKEQTQLIVTGPWAYVRHPIYALSTLLMIASVVIVPTWLMFIIAAVHLVLLQWEARREETHLLNQHGRAYGDYCRHVPAFIPRRLRPYDPSSIPPPPTAPTADPGGSAENKVAIT